MKYIKPTYKINDSITFNTLHSYGFRKTFEGEIIYRFVVYKYLSRKPLIFCEFIFDEEEKQIHIITKDLNGMNYNYNPEEYGKSDVIKMINCQINKEINKLIKESIVVEE